MWVHYNCQNGPTITKKGNVILKWFLRYIYKPSNFPFLAIVGPSKLSKWIHNYQKKKYYSKTIFEMLMFVIKISFFGNCGSHHCLYKPSKYPFLVIVGPSNAWLIHQNFLFGNCGSNHSLHNSSNCQKRKFHFKIIFEVVMPAIKNFLFW